MQVKLHLEMQSRRHSYCKTKAAAFIYSNS